MLTRTTSSNPPIAYKSHENTSYFIVFLILNIIASSGIGIGIGLALEYGPYVGVLSGLGGFLVFTAIFSTYRKVRTHSQINSNPPNPTSNLSSTESMLSTPIHPSTSSTRTSLMPSSGSIAPISTTSNTPSSTHLTPSGPISSLSGDMSSVSSTSASTTTSVKPRGYFAEIDSSKLLKYEALSQIKGRKDFLMLQDQGKYFPPPMIGKSHFIPKEMVEHLMRRKKDSAIGVKYVGGQNDQITNMEGALHTFVTPVCQIFLTGDYRWMGNATGALGKNFENNAVRCVILSAAIHPDFEDNQVIFKLIALEKDPIIGEIQNLSQIPSAAEKMDDTFRQNYDARLRQHMVYFLTEDHSLPSYIEVSAGKIIPEEDAIAHIQKLIKNPSVRQCNFKDRYVQIGPHRISLEMLFSIYLEQLRNEFKILNTNAPQGYIYTISPPSIFARYLGGARILNRLQALAFKCLASEGLFSNMVALAFSDYADSDMIELFQKALPDTSILSADYLNANPQLLKGVALVLHNNSDGFGQNIETEGVSSLDGVLGSFSSAACTLRRNHPDLLKFVF